jgi:hypothetical protein
MQQKSYILTHNCTKEKLAEGLNKKKGNNCEEDFPCEREHAVLPDSHLSDIHSERIPVR